jgi:hypothetical protein
MKALVRNREELKIAKKERQRSEKRARLFWTGPALPKRRRRIAPSTIHLSYDWDMQVLRFSFDISMQTLYGYETV